MPAHQPGQQTTKTSFRQTKATHILKGLAPTPLTSHTMAI